MKIMAALAFALLLALTGGPTSHAAAGKIAVVAAENFYGDIARQIGGDHVTVTSILNSPDQDPHLFEAAPSTVREIANAQVVVFNGAHYDPWMEKLLKAARRPARTVINAAKLTGKKDGDNPHLWYAPATMSAVAKELASAFAKADPANAAEYEARLKTTLAGLAAIDARVTQMKAKHAGKVVGATEPVFGLMTEALGLTMRNERFQRAMTNHTEPSARDIAAFESDIKARRIKLLIYNTQVSEKLPERLRDIAIKANVPVVGVTETMPPGVTFQDWVSSQLDALDKALSEPSS